MKVKELLDILNLNLKDFKNIKYASSSEYSGVIKNKLELIIKQTKLNSLLLIYEFNTIRLLKEGEILFQVNICYKEDARIKSPVKRKGIIKSANISLGDGLDVSLLEFESYDLPLYFSKKHIIDNIDDCNSDIEDLKIELLKLENKKLEFEKQLVKINIKC